MESGNTVPMRYFAFLPITLILLLAVGCETGTPSVVGVPRRTGDALIVYAAQDADAPVPFSVVVGGQGAALALHEPAEGVLLGAWADAGLAPAAFNNNVGRQHALFVHEMPLGAALPLGWILQVMAAGGTPLFYLPPPHDFDGGAFPTDELTELALALGAYNTPMFLAFFPLGEQNNIAAHHFVSAFRLARIIFRIYAPQVAFVWLPPQGEEASPAHPFYPGHDAVDWVGVRAVSLRTREAPKDVLEEIASTHAYFQHHKPLMLLPLGISHFSRVRYAYYVEDTAAEIARVYAALAGFPRVKAVIWRDVLRYGANWDSMTVAQVRELSDAYAAATSDTRFHSTLPASYQPRTHTHIRARRHGYFYRGAFFIDMETLTSELSAVPPAAVTEINGRRFADVTLLQREVTICTNTRIMRID